MLSRIMISVATAVALVATPMASAARSCILVNAPSQEACQSPCCLNMTCCVTSANNTAPSTQPLAKNGSAPETNAIGVPAVVAVLPRQPWEESRRCQINSGSGGLLPPQL